MFKERGGESPSGESVVCEESEVEVPWSHDPAERVLWWHAHRLQHNIGGGPSEGTVVILGFECSIYVEHHMYLVNSLECHHNRTRKCQVGISCEVIETTAVTKVHGSPLEL